MSDWNDRNSLPNSWQLRRVDSLLRSKIRDFGSFSMTNLIDFVDAGIPFIKSEAVQNGFIDKQNIAFITSSVHRLLDKSVVREGNILFTKIGAIGRVVVYNGELGECNSNAATAKIEIDASKADRTYIAYQLGSERVMREFEKTIISTPPRINLGDINAMEIELPPLPEQKKIAKILTTVDRLIEKTEALIAKYQAMKQGMMHDLFTRGVNESGHLRPPQSAAPHLYKQSPLGWIPNEWESITLIETVPSVRYGISCSLDDANGIPVLRMNNLKNGTVSLADLKYSDSNEAKTLLLKFNDVLFNRTNSIEHVGRTSIWKNEIPIASFASYLVRLTTDEDKMLPDLLNLWLNLPATQIAIRQFSTPGVHQVNINPTNLRRTLLALPASLSEQKHIIKRITQIQTTIRTETEQLTKFQTLKTALMQDLLTGKVRVKVDEEMETVTDGH